MDKQTILALIKDSVFKNIIYKSDVLDVFDELQLQSVTKKRLNVSQILYGLGSAVVLVGILVLLFQNWHLLNSLARILISLGSGVAAYIIGMLVFGNNELRRFSILAYALSLILVPIGVAVTFFEMNADSSSLVLAAGMALYVMAMLLYFTNALLEKVSFVGFIVSALALSIGSVIFLTDTSEINSSSMIQFITSGALLVLFAISYFLYKKVDLFLALIIAFSTWLYFSVIGLIFDNHNTTWEIYQYATIVAGVAYIFLGKFFSGEDNRKRINLVQPLFVIGLLAVLAASLSIGGFWDAIYWVVIFGVIYLSVIMHNNVFLKIGAIFLMIYIIKISVKYFAGSLGWPLMLVITGILLVAIGYLTVFLNKKYITNSSV
ncbi:MAG: DUF2157 domain-containing protein [Patescibacteria group bacterium]